MNNKAWIVGAIWGAALATALFLWLGRREVENARGGPPELPVHSPVSDAAPRTGGARTIAPPPRPEPPRMYRLAPHHGGRSAFAGPTSPTVAWKFRTEAPISAQVVADAEGNLYVGSHDHFLYALTSGGELRWKQDLGDQIYGTPYVDEAGNVYVGSDADSVFSFTSAGTLRWKLLMRGDADTGIMPLPNGDLVTAAGRDVWSFTRDGRAVWRFEAQGKIFATPAIDTDGSIYVGSQDDAFYALAPDGRMRWTHRTRADVDSAPVIDEDGRVYVGSDDKRVYAFERDGTLKWTHEVPGFVRGPLGLSADGLLLVPTYGPHPALVALDRVRGEERWAFATTAAQSEDFGIASGPMVDRDGTIFFGAQDDYLYALSPAGALRWIFEAGHDIDPTPLITPSGLLVFGSDEGFVTALR
jgi:outer membrane protein assembly factor BamB